MRTALFSAICLVLFLAGANNGLASEFRSADEVTITKRVTGDLYVAAGVVTINAVVEGDVVVAGGTVHIGDSVLQDVLVTGGQVEINGYVGDDVRVAGGQVEIKQSIGGDVLAFSGDVRLEDDATVAGEVRVFAGSIWMAATVRGNARLKGGDVSISGSVLGDLDARGGQITMKGMVAGSALLAADDLTISEPAQFSGSLRYWTEDGELDLAAFMIQGTPVFDPDLEIDSNLDWRYFGIGMVLFWFLSIFSSAILILLLVLVFPKWISRTGKDTETNWWKHILYGLAYFLGAPVVIGILFLTVIGIPFALILMMFYIFSMLYGSTFGSIGLASFLTHRISSIWNKWIVVFLALGIVIVVKITALLPFLGWLIIFLFILYGIGALISNIKSRTLHAHSGANESSPRD